MRRRRRRGRWARWTAGAIWLVVVGAPCFQRLFGLAAGFEPGRTSAARDAPATVSRAASESLAAVLGPGGLRPIGPRRSEGPATMLALASIGAEAERGRAPADPLEVDGAPAGPTGLRETPEPEGRLVAFTVTAYCPCRRCCGKWAGDGMTASGLPITYNGGKFVAADTSVLPFLTRVRVPGYAGGEPVPVIDRGGKVRGRRVDVYFPTHGQAQRWGKKRLVIEILD